MTKLVQRASASSSMCVVSRQQPPAALISPKVLQMPRRLRGSRPVVGSSRIATAGEPTMAQPTAKRRLMPPLRVPGSQSCFSSKHVARRIFTTLSPAAGPERPRMLAKSRMFSLTVKSSLSTVSCGQSPMRAGPRAPSRMDTVPCFATSSPVMQRIVVVLPAPLGPNNPRVAPAATSKLTPFTTVSSWLESCLTRELPGTSTEIQPS
mmetsp:Transcript_36184/g.100467  ORF Transcript_36184/g.100467 Transcript_36184/m.100467 type:complete len:207 (-) Transcript_36184:1644-2264(-)